MYGHHPHAHARAYEFGQACCCCGAPVLHRMCDCGDVGHGTGFHRRFMSRAERIAQLENYLADLQAEAQAVQEKLTTLRRAERE